MQLQHWNEHLHPWRSPKARKSSTPLLKTTKHGWGWGSLIASAGTHALRALRIGPELHGRTGFETHCGPQTLFTTLTDPQTHPDIVYIQHRHIIQAAAFAMRIRHLNLPVDLYLGNPHSSSAKSSSPPFRQGLKQTWGGTSPRPQSKSMAKPGGEPSKILAHSHVHSPPAYPASAN